MTQEDKELLLRDLCARLPYGVKVCIDDDTQEPEVLYEISTFKPNPHFSTQSWLRVYIENIKPFLRSFKSMTKDERSEYYKRCKSYHYKRTWKYCRSEYGETLYRKEPRSYTAFYRTPEALDYLNSIHVDYRGLIKKGLALKAERGMYDNTENEANR